MDKKNDDSLRRITFAELCYRIGIAREERNSALFLGLDYSSEQAKLSRLQSELTRRKSGQRQIDKFNQRYAKKI